MRETAVCSYSWKPRIFIRSDSELEMDLEPSSDTNLLMHDSARLSIDANKALFPSCSSRSLAMKLDFSSLARYFSDFLEASLTSCMFFFRSRAHYLGSPELAG